MKDHRNSGKQNSTQNKAHRNPLRQCFQNECKVNPNPERTWAAGPGQYTKAVTDITSMGESAKYEAGRRLDLAMEPRACHEEKEKKLAGDEKSV